MIIPPPGYWLLQIDYSVLELRTLAQICLKRYGKSVLADLFKRGVDPHRYTAALFLNMTLEQFGLLPKAEQKQNRQRAKALNFGIPGGLGAASLVTYAKQSYGVELQIEQAKAFRQKLITRIYPELAAYLQDSQVADMAANLQTTTARVRQAFGQRDQRFNASRIVAGITETPAGKKYQPALVTHVWLCLQQLNNNAAIRQELKAEQPSSLLMRRIFFGHALTISGRLRGHVGFSQKANTPFQGLAADGNKLALFKLLRAGFQVCGFVHDEMLVLIPDGTDYQAATDQVQQILASAMQELCPDIPICTEYLLADRWYKDVDAQPRDEQGRIVPYQRVQNN
jgi:DNA polymerase I-like protein with 3'-5' exonuclease and polymerase domains